MVIREVIICLVQQNDDVSKNIEELKGEFSVHLEDYDDKFIIIISEVDKLPDE